MDLSSGTATLSLRLPEAWAPEVYIHVVAFHAIGDKAVPFASSRGLIYLPLSRPEGVANLMLKAPERFKPGTPITLSLEAPRHPRARIFLTGLDEGVWVKQMYKPRRPEEVFYQKWAHTLNVSEHLPFVASWGREVIGGDFLGDTEVDDGSLLTAEAYEHTIAYERVLQLDEKGRAEVRLTLPAFSGKIRWRAYLVEEGVYGSAEAFGPSHYRQRGWTLLPASRVGSDRAGPRGLCDAARWTPPRWLHHPHANRPPNPSRTPHFISEAPAGILCHCPLRALFQKDSASFLSDDCVLRKKH